MDVRLDSQSLRLLAALAAGALLGLSYDLLRPIRHRSGRFAALGMDGLFCLGALGVMFALAMSSASGKLGTWESLASLLGFVLYLNIFSEAFLGIYVPCIRAISRIIPRFKIIIKKSAISAKFFFQKVRECFIIKQ